MAKDKTIYTCSECGGTSPKWLGKCPSCGAWNTLEEGVAESASASKHRFQSLAKSQPVATLSRGGEQFDRDCSRAFADCDESSPTGCTDRLFSACGPRAGADRCDGNVRLGCDGSGQVSFHDCEVLGGTCEATSSGADCVYAPGPDPGCAASSGSPTTGTARCEGALLSLCVTGQRVTVAGSNICP